MSQKRFCDICSREIDVALHGKHGWSFDRMESISSRGDRLNIYVNYGVYQGNNIWDGDFCRYCVIDEINKQDDRERSA